jgi:ATPase subunit of ABC transporter with duplicated ATPase domains
MTSHDREFMNRIVTKIVEIDGGELTPTRATTTSTSSSARSPRQQQAQYERQQAMLAKEIALHRALQGARERTPRRCSPGEEARQDREGRAAEAPQVVEFDFRPPPRSGEDVAKLEGVHKAYGSRHLRRASTSWSAAASAGA